MRRNAVSGPNNFGRVLYLNYIRWEAECSMCGVLDSGLSKREAAKTLARHEKRHCPICDARLSINNACYSNHDAAGNHRP
jgi:hypothetical protein